MARNRPKYRRSLRAAGILRLALLGLLAMGIGSTFVYVRTQSVARGNEKHTYEREITSLRSEITALDGRIDAMTEREAMVRRLKMLGSDLAPVERYVSISVSDPEAQFASLEAEPSTRPGLD